MFELEKDLPYLEKLRPLIEPIAHSFGLSPAVVAGVISRESGGGRLLGKHGCPPGTGDQGHGHGLMQIDDRWHHTFLSLPDFWRFPAANIAYGCYLLHQNQKTLDRALPKLPESLRLRAALAAYNAGLGRILQGLRQGKDPDRFTAGQDYAYDVLARAAWLRNQGWK